MMAAASAARTDLPTAPFIKANQKGFASFLSNSRGVII